MTVLSVTERQEVEAELETLRFMRKRLVMSPSMHWERRKQALARSDQEIARVKRLLAR